MIIVHIVKIQHENYNFKKYYAHYETLEIICVYNQPYNKVIDGSVRKPALVQDTEYMV